MGRLTGNGSRRFPQSPYRMHNPVGWMEKSLSDQYTDKPTKLKNNMDSSFESIVGRAILDGTDEARQLASDKVTLKMLVMQKMFCDKTGKVLDQGSAIALEIVSNDGGERWIGPFDPSACRDPEETRAALAAKVEQMPTVKEVRLLNGAELFPASKKEDRNEV